MCDLPARYFTHLRYRKKFFRDEEGDELESDAAARDHAVATAKDMILRTRTDIIHDWFDCTFEVSDQAGRIVFVLPFGDTVASDEPSS
jgi:hypothetical protein